MTASESHGRQQLTQRGLSSGRSGELEAPTSLADVAAEGRELLPEEAPSDAETVPGNDAASLVAKETLPHRRARLTRAKRTRTERSLDKAIDEEETVKAFSLSDLQEIYDATRPEPAHPPAMLAKSTSVGTRLFDEEMEQSVLEMESLPPSQGEPLPPSQVETIEVHDTQECICVAAGSGSTPSAVQDVAAIDVEQSQGEAEVVSPVPSSIWVAETEDSVVVVGDSVALEETADTLSQPPHLGAELAAASSGPEASPPSPRGAAEAREVAEAREAAATVAIEEAWQARAHEAAQDANDSFTLEFNRRLDVVREKEKRRRLTTF